MKPILKLVLKSSFLQCLFFGVFRAFSFFPPQISYSVIHINQISSNKKIFANKAPSPNRLQAGLNCSCMKKLLPSGLVIRPPAKCTITDGRLRPLQASAKIAVVITGLKPRIAGRQRRRQTMASTMTLVVVV